MKVCLMCRRELPLESFHRAHGRPDGRQAECKECANRRHREKGYGRAYYERNRANVLARQEAKRRAAGARPTRKTVGTRRVAGKYVVVKIAEPGVWQAEHRAVMEKQLGRSLAWHETVHHVNGDKHDNRPANLQLVHRRKHATGIAPMCACCGSRDLTEVPL